MEENILITTFMQNYIKMSDLLSKETSWRNQLSGVNCALYALIEAKDHLSEIDKLYIYNTLTIAMSFAKKY